MGASLVYGLTNGTTELKILGGIGKYSYKAISKAVPALGKTAAKVGSAARSAFRCEAQLGTKLEYVFGKATGSKHNIERSTGMLNQLQNVGIFDNAIGRSILDSHLKEIYKSSKGLLQNNGRHMRESLLFGPHGGLKVACIWDGEKLITLKLFGGS